MLMLRGWDENGSTAGAHYSRFSRLPAQLLGQLVQQSV